jgi:uncharacterized protein
MPAIRRRREFGWLAVLLVVIQPLGFTQGKPTVAGVGRALGYVERQVAFPNETSLAPATLCLPTSREKKVAAVVLVRAIGPEQGASDDRAAFMFADLAHGLAQAGIATLRYDPPPYSFSKAPDPTKLPIDQQIVNPAVAALAYVSGIREIDSSAVFILGHGMAGMVAPYIAARYPDARGVILMGAAALPVEKTLAQQKKIELQKQGMSAQEIEDIVAAQNQTFADIRSGKMQPSRLYAGATVAYWRDRMNRDPARKARSLDVPILVLQGANDTEVHEADYDRLQWALGKKAGGMTQFHWFPDLNHVFMSSKKDVQPSSSQPSNVHPEVIRVIASWMESQARSASPKK